MEVRKLSPEEAQTFGHSDKDLLRRARLAWLTYANDGPEPTWAASTVENLGGRIYVVLRLHGRVVDIYRYKPETPGFRDTLKRLSKRVVANRRRYWPAPYGGYTETTGYAAA